MPGSHFSLRPTLAAAVIFMAVAAISLGVGKPGSWGAVLALPKELQPSAVKLPEFFGSLSESAGGEGADTLLLGSSLVARAVARCDDAVAGRKPRYDSFYTEEKMARYAQAEYLERLVPERRFANLAVYGAMASDDYLILKRALASGAKPNLVICGICPRDFAANDAPDVDQSQFFRVLGEPQELVAELLPGGMASKPLAQRGQLVYQIARQRLSDLWAQLLSRTPHAPLTLATGIVYPNKECYVAKKDKFPDLWLYGFRYNPPNYARFNQQLGYFEKLLALAQEHSIRCVIVDMPLTRQNEDLIDRAFLSGYKKSVAAVSTKYGARYIDFSRLCQPDEFEDSCHLNGQGGQRLLVQVAQQLESRQVGNTLSKHGRAL